MEFLTNDLLAARSTMAFSLGFHIVFACVGMVMPFLMATSHWMYLKHGDPVHLTLTKLWSKGVAVHLFATGAVSGTVLSFELGLLWPEFMRHAGPIIGMPFSWEGTAFFVEAIAIGIFFYGWDRVPKWAHWASGLVVGLAGLASGIFIVAANSWMNTPAGFDHVDGVFQNIRPVAAMFNPHWFQQALHMVLAAFVSVGFAVAGIHALFLLKGKQKKLNTAALKIALAMGAGAAILQPLSGHLSAQKVAQNQPAKLAAMEAHFHTEAGADLLVGGWPDPETQTVRGALRIPKGLSFLAFDDFTSVVKGLDQFPRDQWPNVRIVHTAFDIMVGIGTLLALIGIYSLLLLIRKKPFPQKFLRLLVVLIPAGFIALESGWVVTEVGRQPWIIYNVLRTRDAVASMPGIGFHFGLFLLLYLFIAAVCIYLMYRMIRVSQND